MEFNFISTISIDDTYLDAMTRRFIKAQRDLETLDEIITDEISGMDDSIWLYLDDIIDEVRDEVIRRANKIKKVYLTK
jgi:hypothetical protein